MVFSQFLEDIHEKEYSGTMNFETWVNQLPATEWITYGDRFAELERDFVSIDLTELDYQEQ